MAEEEFSITGLAPSYAFVVMTVNKHDGISIGEVASIMQLTPSTVTRLIEKLEVKDILTRTSEGRNTLIFSTEKGKAMQQVIQKAWRNLYKRYAAVLGEAESTKLAHEIFQAKSNLEQ